MRPVNHPTYAFLLPSLLLFLFLLLPTLPQAESADVYQEKAFMPAAWCTSADISPDRTTIYARAHFGDWNEGVRLYSGVTYQHVRDFENLPNVPWTILASADGNHVYASHYYGGAVVKLDASTGAVVKSIAVGPWPHYMAFDSYRRFLYVGVNAPGRGAVGWVSVIDTSTDIVVGRVDLNGEPGRCPAISPDDAFLYILSRRIWHGEPATLFKIATADLSLVGTVALPAGVGPGVSTSPDGHFVYVADGAAGRVRVIGTDSLTETDTYAIPDVQNFSVAPSGENALAIGHAPDSSEVLIYVFDLSTASIVQTLSRTVTGPTDIVFVNSPILWDTTTGRAFIAMKAENGGVIVLSPAEEEPLVVYQTDFSSDPQWTTNSPGDFYWNEADGNYYFKRRNTGEQYSYKSIPFDPGASYRLEFDVYITRCDWAASLYLGLGDPDMDIGSATAWHVSYHKVDQGKTASLIYLDSEGGSYHPGGLQPAPFQLNTWYHNAATYDAAAGTLSLRVTKVSDGSLVGEVELTGVGSFAGVDRLYMSSVGHHYAPGATVEGYVDNLRLTRHAAYARATAQVLSLSKDVLRIAWDSMPGLEYQLWAASNLPSDEWAPMGPRMGGTGDQLYIDDYVIGVRQKFYRVQKTQP